jgi:N-acetylmuramoyl-L-alanine amidase
MACPPLWVAAATSIIIAGQPHDVGRPVVLWCDAERGFDGYAEACVEPSSMGESVCCVRSFRRYGARAGVRPGSLPDLQRTVHQLVLHHDGCVNSRSCFRSMHDMPRADGGCGLSAHFMIDADGTIYQTLDVTERALHAGRANQGSVGVELCNRGDAGRDELDRLPADYRTRAVRTVVINQRAHQAFDFRPEQYASVTALARVLLRALPQIRPLMPEAGGKPLLATLADPLGFRGIVGHFHVDSDQRKWDPGAFDWAQLLDSLHALYLPVAVRGHDRFPQDDVSRLQAMTRSAFFNAEAGYAGAGSTYPVGFGGLWDPGISLLGAPQAPIRAPARGMVVAARRGDTTTGTRGFVLMRHDEDLGPRGQVRIFTRLSGLTPALVQPGAQTWLQSLAGAQRSAILQTLAAGRTALLDQPIEAGDVVGVADGQRAEGGVRFELFTAGPLPAALAQSFVLADGTGDGPVCARAGILHALGVARASAFGQQAAAALVAEGGADQRQLLRRMSVRLRHPFGDRARAEAFLAAPALAGLSLAERRGLFAQVIASEVFWTDALSRHAGLPRSQTVYFHHPLTFLASLAALRGGLPLRWPSADFQQGTVPTAGEPEAGRGALAWLRPAVSVRQPLRLGPIVRPSFPAPARAEIPLVVLPPLEER